jgi:hypothetical protein
VSVPLLVSLAACPEALVGDEHHPLHADIEGVIDEGSDFVERRIGYEGGSFCFSPRKEIMAGGDIVRDTIMSCCE